MPFINCLCRAGAKQIPRPRPHGCLRPRTLGRAVGITVSLVLAVVVTANSGGSAVAQSLTKANTATMNTATDWGGTAPTLTGTGVFTNVLSASNAAALTLGGDVSLARLEFQNINGPVTIAAGGTLTLANTGNATNAGIQMSNANLNHDVTINAALVNVGTLHIKGGRTLTLGGGATNIGISSGSGAVVLRTGTFGILGSANLNVGDWSNTQTTGFLVGDNAVVPDLRNVGRTAAGVMRVNGVGAIVSSTNTQDLNVGRDAGGRGLLQLDQGTISVGRNVFVGFSGAGEGILRVNGGTMNINTTLNVGSGSSSFEMIGGVAYFGATTGTAAAITSVGTITLSGGTMGAANNWTSAADMRLGTTNGSVTFQAAGASGTARNISLSGVLSNNGAQAGGLIKTASGTLTLSNANTFSGDTRVDAGTLALANVNAIQNSTLDLGAGAVSFAVSGTNNYALAGLKGSGGLALGANSITVGSGNGETTFSGALSGSASAGMIKVGTGALLLNGASTSFSGSTSITGGRLQIGPSGSLNSTSGVVVNGNGAEFRYNSATPFTRPLTLTQGLLSGTGTINTAVTIGANVVHSPGNSPGFQTVANATWNPGGTYLWEINDWNGTAGNAANGFDQIAVTGTLDVAATSGGPFTIQVAGLTSSNTVGAVPNFNNAARKQFTIATSGSLAGFAGSDFTINTTSFSGSNSLSNGGFAIGQSGNNVVLTYIPSAVYDLSATASAAAIHVGGATTITARITSSTAAVSNPDDLVYAGLALSGGLGTVSPNGTVIAGGSASGGAIFTGTTAGAFTFTPSITSGSNATINTAANAGTAAGVTVSVYNLAAAGLAAQNLSSGTINFGTVLTGTPLAQSLAITNTAPVGSYTERLDAAIGSVDGMAAGSGAISLLAAGGTSTALGVQLASGSAGVASGSVQVNFTSNGDGTSGLGTTSLAPQTVSLVGTILDPAVASFTSSAATTSLLLDFGTLNQASGSQSLSFDLWNLVQTPGYTADLALTSLTSGTGNTSAITTNLTTFNSLAAGASNSWQASLSMANLGSFENSYILSLRSATNGTAFAGDTPQNLTLTVRGAVIVPEPGALVLAAIGLAGAGALASRRRRTHTADAIRA